MCRAFKNLKIFSGLNSFYPYSTSRFIYDLASIRQGSRFLHSNRGAVKTRATLVSGEGDLLSYTNSNNVLASSTLDNDKPIGIEMQPLDALSADIAPTISGFPVDSDEFDLDCPTEEFASIAEAIEDIRQGKVTYFLYFL